MRALAILILFLIILIIQTAQALTINIEGDCVVGHKLKIYTDKPALIILRMNDGTPIYANTSAYFTPQVTGVLKIEAISGDERASKTVSIVQSTGGGGIIGEFYLPDGTTTITLEDGSEVEVKWRTALGILIRVSEVKGFSLKVKRYGYGLFVDCIGGICTKALGSTSGWMYSVNVEIPMVSSDQYNLEAGDTVIWYFSRSMSDTPENSPYKIELKSYSDWSFDVKITPSMPWSLHSEGERGDSAGGGGVISEGKAHEKPKVTITNKTVKAIFTGNATLSINITKIPIKLSVSTTKPVEIILKEAKPIGLEFNQIYSKVFDCFTLKPNSSVNLTLSFEIPKENVTSPRDVYLAHYDGRWTFIPTNYTENETHYVFTVNLTNFSLFAIVERWKGFPLDRNNSTIVKALNWLRIQQREDGGWGSLANTSWVVMAIASAGENPLNWTKNGKTPLDYFRENLNESTVKKMGTTDFARTILALIALNQNPYDFNGINFVKLLKERVKENGQIGDYVYTTIWGIIALRACGENVSKSVEWLKYHQNPDGGFAWALSEESDFDDTASAIMALIAGNVSRDDETIVKALRYLKKGQCEDGGMRFFGNSPSNSASDSWTIWALISANVNPLEWRRNNASVVDHLLSLQSNEGYFNYTRYVTSNPIYMTSCAVIALTGKTHPIKIFEREVVTPVTIPRQTTTTVETVETTTTTTFTATTTVTKPVPDYGISLAIVSLALAIYLRKS